MYACTSSTELLFNTNAICCIVQMLMNEHVPY